MPDFLNPKAEIRVGDTALVEMNTVRRAHLTPSIHFQNIQHSTFNAQRRRLAPGGASRTFKVERKMLNVFPAVQMPGF
jgi:hypothetical protein